MEIVKVQILNEAGEPAGREYSYFTAEPLALGDIVQVPVTGRGEFPEDHMVKAQVVTINVSEESIAAFKDKVKVIPSGSKRPPTQDEDFIPDPEAEAYREALDKIPEPTVQREMFDEGEMTPDERAGLTETSQEPEDPPADLLHELATPPEEAKVAEEGLFDTTGDAVAYPSALNIIERKFGPPVPQELFKLYHQAAGLLEYAKNRVISTNADLKPATDDLAVILQCRKEMETRKAEMVGPMRAELDRFYQAFNDLMAPVLEAEKLTKSKVSEFEANQRLKAAEAKRIEDEKFRLAQEEAALNGTGEISVPLDTAQAPPPVPERTRTEMGTLSGRDNWKAKVIDFAALPDEYKVADMVTLNAKARSTKGQAVIPGVEFFNDRTYQVRTAG